MCSAFKTPPLAATLGMACSKLHRHLNLQIVGIFLRCSVYDQGQCTFSTPPPSKTTSSDIWELVDNLTMPDS